MKKFSHFAALLAAVLMLFTAVPTANAAIGDPAYGLHWDGYMAMWDPIYDSNLWGYNLVVMKDYSTVTDYTIGTPYMDLTELLKNCGPGEYYFMVSVYYEDGGMIIDSAYSYSPSLNYNGELEHKHTLKYRSASDPTCTDDGSIGFFVCTGCNEYFYDEYATQPIYNHNDVIRPALGHDWNDWFVRKEATETSEGLMERVCKRDTGHYQTKTIPKLPAKTQQPTKEEKKQETTKVDSKKSTTAPASTKPTVAGSTAATAPTANTQSVTVPGTTVPGGDNGGNFLKALVGSPIIWIVAGILGFLLLIVTPGVIVLIILLSKKKKNNSQ